MKWAGEEKKQIRVLRDSISKQNVPNVLKNMKKKIGKERKEGNSG